MPNLNGMGPLGMGSLRPTMGMGQPNLGGRVGPMQIKSLAGEMGKRLPMYLGQGLGRPDPAEQGAGRPTVYELAHLAQTNENVDPSWANSIIEQHMRGEIDDDTASFMFEMLLDAASYKERKGKEEKKTKKGVKKDAGVKKGVKK